MKKRPPQSPSREEEARTLDARFDARSEAQTPEVDSFPSVPPAGTVLAGKYRVERVLGSGAMGVVAAARHLQLDIRVAIKYLVPAALEYPEIVERFAREARAAAQIRSEHVARVIDVGVLPSGVPFMVLEYLEGEDLAAHLEQRGRLAIVDAVRYVLEMCEALAEAHSANIVHRDLKPANVFLAKQADRRRIVKVLDFGISKIMNEHLTSPTRMLGTAQYMSPEHLESSKLVDHKTDIWALGVILYELLSGVRPFVGHNLLVIAESVKANQPRPLVELRPDVPEELQAVVARCMKSAPSDRYASVLDLAIDLAPFADSRDRESVRTISGVLCGSIAPPPTPGGPKAEGDEAAWRAPRVARAIPEPRSSEMPVTAPTIIPPGLPSEAAPTAPEPTRAETPKKPRRAASYALLAGTTLAATAALTMFANRAPPPPARTSTLPPAASSLPAQAGEVWLKLDVSPPQARVRIDDGPLVPTTLALKVPRDDREHRVQIEAEGFVTQVETLRFTADLTLTRALAPIRTELAPGQ